MKPTRHKVHPEKRLGDGGLRRRERKSPVSGEWVDQNLMGYQERVGGLMW
jgi:hypothetical protein